MVDRVVLNVAKNAQTARRSLDSLRLPPLSVGECMNCVTTEAARLYTQTLYEAVLRENERLRQENARLLHENLELRGVDQLEGYEVGDQPYPEYSDVEN